MRLESVKEILPTSATIETINVQEIIDKGSKFERILAYRFKTGPLVNKVNITILKSALKNEYDMVWVEKGVLLRSRTVKFLKSLTNLLIHYTPDPAFLFHKSRKFIKCLPFYDKVVTTKSFELNEYYKHKDAASVIFVTQAFSQKLHINSKKFKERENGIVFIGHHENGREEYLQYLLDKRYKVILSGRGWDTFVKRNVKKANFRFLGKKTYGIEYAKALNNYKYSIGFLSEWIPEKHTTRTFEIPACGCLLLTPDNEELRGIFRQDEALFYNSKEDLLSKLEQLTDEEENQLAFQGYERVVNGPFSHYSIMKQIFKEVGLI